MKTYNIIEALNEPVGTKFNAINGNGNKDVVTVVETSQKKLVWSNSSSIVLNDFTASLKLIKVRKPLTFFQAMALVDEGNKVTNDYLLEEISKDNYYFKKNNKLYYYCGKKNSNYALVVTSRETEVNWYEYKE